jgi:hypothetical protein
VVFCVLTPCRGFGEICYIQRRAPPRRRQRKPMGIDRLADPGVCGKLDADIKPQLKCERRLRIGLIRLLCIRCDEPEVRINDGKLFEWLGYC